MNKKKPLPAKPFFTRFLEQQQLHQVSGGKPPADTTQKFPSDNDEEGA
jgi:hypothetical protein